ncbi:BTB/POZ domain-containing protein 6, partial [Aphelenchoides avenae]
YVYTDEALLTDENVLFTMYLSKKYFVTGLYGDCIEFAKNKVDASNVCSFLEHAELFDDLKEAYVIGWAHLDSGTDYDPIRNVS